MCYTKTFLVFFRETKPIHVIRVGENVFEPSSFVCFAHSKLHLFAHNKRILINNRFSLITKKGLSGSEESISAALNL